MTLKAIEQVCNVAGVSVEQLLEKQPPEDVRIFRQAIAYSLHEGDARMGLKQISKHLGNTPQSWHAAIAKHKNLVLCDKTMRRMTAMVWVAMYQGYRRNRYQRAASAPEKTQIEVAELLGIDREKLRIIEQSAYAKIRASMERRFYGNKQLATA